VRKDHKSSPRSRHIAHGDSKEDNNGDENDVNYGTGSHDTKWFWRVFTFDFINIHVNDFEAETKGLKSGYGKDNSYKQNFYKKNVQVKRRCNI
jgi:hypothetical protein